MATVSKKLVENKFKRFVQALGGKVATAWNDVGAFALDHNSVYGGYTVVQIVNASGGVSSPFGYHRMKASQFVDALDFATQALEYKHRIR